MPGAARISLLALISGLALAGCGGGGDKSIPADQGDMLLTRLDEIEGAVEGGNCDGAAASAELFATQVDGLPEEVDDEVKRLLIGGAERLTELVTDCEPTPTGPSGFEAQQPTTAPAVTSDETTTETTITEGEETDGGGGPPQSPPGQGGDNPGGGNPGGSGQTGGIGNGGDG